MSAFKEEFYSEEKGFQLDAPSVCVCVSQLAPRTEPQRRGGKEGGWGWGELPAGGKTCLGTFFPINSLMKENTAPPKLIMDF